MKDHEEYEQLRKQTIDEIVNVINKQIRQR